MAIDPSRFHLWNVADTCAIWNILSSKVLYSASIAAHCIFSCTAFVYYECLHKQRTNISFEEVELQRRLQQEMNNGQFKTFHIDLDDLNDIEVLEKRRNLSKGELSSMVFAIRTQQALITDDQGARKLASHCMSTDRVQTTPHLFGWLIYSGILGDSDKDDVIKEHMRFARPLQKYFNQIYLKALEYRLAHDVLK
jgi:hypothetical protein